jgi:hypothetical protein
LISEAANVFALGIAFTACSLPGSDLSVNWRAENMPSQQDEQDEQQQAIHNAAIWPKKSAAGPIRREPEYKPNEHQDPISNGDRHFLILLI